MFKISKIILIGRGGNEYEYVLKNGLNYFKGSNNTGKTAFYKFIDYMLGSSENINDNDWNNGTIQKAIMEIQCDEKQYTFTRTNNVEENYFRDNNDIETESIGLAEYREHLGNIFSHNEDELRKIREFSGEKYTYRTFTMFNFLGENRQGEMWDFLDKCKDIKYSIKLDQVLNYVFNKNNEEIEWKNKKLKHLKEELKAKEAKQCQYEFYSKQVNDNLLKLNIDTRFNGNNADEIKNELKNIEYQLDYSVEKVENTISELEVIYSNISEQIKVYETVISTYKHTKKVNENREKLLNNLKELLQEESELGYLVEPIEDLLNEIGDSISFSNYIINDETVAVLKKQREKIKEEMKLQDAKHKCFSIEDKIKAATLIREYLSLDIKDNTAEVENLKKQISELKKELKNLQAMDDQAKIDAFSDVINQLYFSAVEESPFVKYDLDYNVRIKYIKKGNGLQMVTSADYYDGEVSVINKGSMARHTLLQLCGYLAFLALFTQEKKYPIIPLFVIDHISKPFSLDNERALGAVFEKFYKICGEDNVQIIMFDDCEANKLGIYNACETDLVKGNKSGFNPFYSSN